MDKVSVAFSAKAVYNIHIKRRKEVDAMSKYHKGTRHGMDKEYVAGHNGSRNILNGHHWKYHEYTKDAFSSKGLSLTRLHAHKVMRHITSGERNSAWHVISTNGKTISYERAARVKFLSHYNKHYDRLIITGDDAQVWERRFMRAASNKSDPAYTKPTSYLDEFIPF